jgi:hypothetical protein
MSYRNELPLDIEAPIQTGTNVRGARLLSSSASSSASSLILMVMKAATRAYNRLVEKRAKRMDFARLN